MSAPAKSPRVGQRAPKRAPLSPRGRGSQRPAEKEEDALLKIFSANVRRVRQLRGLSQEALADLADLDRTYISSIERMRRNVSIKNIQRLALALRVDPRDLLDPAAAAEQLPAA